MNVTKVTSNNPMFSGLLTLSGPEKEKEVIVNTDNISAIVQKSYFDKKEAAPLGVGLNNGAIIAMNNGTNIYTFVPTKEVVDAYNKAKKDDEYTLKTKFDPVVAKPLKPLL